LKIIDYVVFATQDGIMDGDIDQSTLELALQVWEFKSCNCSTILNVETILFNFYKDEKVNKKLLLLMVSNVFGVY
jgi:hypothetical protein